MKAIQSVKAGNFREYIELLKICVNLAPENSEQINFLRILFAYYTFVNFPLAFDDAEQLNEVDELHSKLNLQFSPFGNSYKNAVADPMEYE